MYIIYNVHLPLFGGDIDMILFCVTALNYVCISIHLTDFGMTKRKKAADSRKLFHYVLNKLLEAKKSYLRMVRTR